MPSQNPSTANIAPSTTALSPPSTPPPLRPLFLTLLIACPLLALVPPRKLDLYTFSLTGAWVLSAEELAFGQKRRQRTGNAGVLGSARVDGSGGGRERALRARLEDGDGDGGGRVEGGGDEEEGVKGLARKIWMGDERAGWQKRRLEREKEELEAGKGYGDIIMEQVREVFPGFGGRREERGEGEKES